MVPFTIDIVQNLGLSILQIINKYYFRARLYLLGAIINIISTILMVYYWGNLGAAISTALTMFITSGIILNIYYQKGVGLNIKGFWKNIGNILIKLSPIILIGYFINCRVLSHQVSFLILILKILVYTFIYCFVLRCFVLNAAEKKYFKDIINRFVPKK